MNSLKVIVLCLLSFGALTSCLTSCATSPEGRRQLMLLPDSQMNEMGVQAFNEMKQKEQIDRNASDNAFVKCVATAITDALPEKQTWEVVVFQDDQVNAFALPGGKIGVLSGLLKVTTTADQLAAVLGHEVGHVLARHGAERASAQLLEQGGLQILGSVLADPGTTKYQLLMAGLGLGTQYGIAMPHSRTQETEADRIGLQLMAKAGFNPQQAVELWRNMDRAGGAQPPEWLSDHPSNANRISDLQAHMNEALALARTTTRKPNCHR
jgi:predicted Zn-dependent protease